MLTYRLLGAPNIYDEIVLSYAVIFSRDPESREIAKQLFHRHQMEADFIGSELPDPRARKIIITKWDMYFQNQHPMRMHFQHYRGHFAFLQEQMDNWKPQTFRDSEVFQPGYNDRFTWYASMFGSFIALIGIAGIITSVFSAVTGYIAMRVGLEALALQKQSNLTTGK